MTRPLPRIALGVLLLAATAMAGAAEETPTPGVPPVKTLATGLALPWSMAFLPDGGLLIVEKAGGVRLFANGRLQPGRIEGLPDDLLIREQSGLHDIALDPDFATTRRVFLAYLSGSVERNRLALWRARLEDGRLVEGERIFRTRPAKKETAHPGGRILFLPDKTLLLSVGDGFDYREAAQDLGSHLGKILRLDRDGHAPPDNPFVDRVGALPEIWSYGHRNPQGLALDPQTGEVWESEHGPLGGDEVNRLRAGGNYGWPRLTGGIDYDGTLISERAHAPDAVSPLIMWSPSIAPSGLAVYRGTRIPGWDGQFLIGALADKALVLAGLDNEGRTIRETTRALGELGARIRDVRVGPDGAVWLLTDEQEGRLLRLAAED
jgi:glucose/arabinose dehydrogenase